MLENFEVEFQLPSHPTPWGLERVPYPAYIPPLILSPGAMKPLAQIGDQHILVWNVQRETVQVVAALTGRAPPRPLTVIARRLIPSRSCPLVAGAHTVISEPSPSVPAFGLQGLLLKKYK